MRGSKGRPIRRPAPTAARQSATLQSRGPLPRRAGIAPCPRSTANFTDGSNGQGMTLEPPGASTLGPVERARPSSDAHERNRVRRWAAFLKEFIRSPRRTSALLLRARPASPPRCSATWISRAPTPSLSTGPAPVFSPALDELHRWLADGEPPQPLRRHRTQPKDGRHAPHDHPEVTIVHDSAANVIEVCRSCGIAPGTVDCIVSGLGWASFTDELRTEILEATAKVLEPGGRFHTFAYQTGFLVPGSWHFRSEIKHLFSEVRTGRVVWGNLPPAFVYQCVK